MEEQLGWRRQCGQHLDVGERLLQLCVAVVLVGSVAAGSVAGVEFDDAQEPGHQLTMSGGAPPQ